MTDPRTALEEAAFAERKHIIAWLRQNGERQYQHGNRSLRQRWFWIKTAIFWPENIFAGAWLGVADALEQGRDGSAACIKAKEAGDGR